MIPYPVHFSAPQPERFTRLQLLLRIAVFVALGMVSVSFGTIFAFVYLALPLYAASRLASLGDARTYLREDGPRVTRALHWLASVFAWVGLVADRLPAHRAEETVYLEIDDTWPEPTTSTAITRILTGLPSAFVLMILGWLGMFVWLWAALSILFVARVGAWPFQYLVGLQRWSVRLLAYQASLVDVYPPFSFSDTTPVLPEAKAMA
jgi:hypothetical protein